jgi:hypothetical protein
MDLIDAALITHNYAENAAVHSGLDFAYKSGAVRQGQTVSATVAGTVTLADDDTSYIEVDPATGTVSDNVTGFTIGKIPLFTVVTASGSITTVTDKRAYFSLDDNIPDTMTTKGDLLLHTGAAYMRLAVGTDGYVPIADSGAAGGISWANPSAAVGDTRGICFYIDGTLTIALKAAFVAPCALTVTNVKMSVATAPTGADLIIDIHKNGTTIFTTQGNRPTIAAGETTEDSAAPDVTSIAAGDLIKLEIDQIGSTIAGADLSATVVCVVA